MQLNNQECIGENCSEYIVHMYDDFYNEFLHFVKSIHVKW